MKQMENSKVSFPTRLKWAIFNPENYDILAIETQKKAFGYLIKLLLIFAFVISIALTIKLAVSYEDTLKNIDHTIQTIGNNDTSVNPETINQIKELPKYEVCIAFFIISTIYLFAVYMISTTIDILLLSILGWFTSRILKVILKYTAIINISVYALTLPILLNAIYIIVNVFTHFEIQYFQIMYNAISYIYVVTAILMIKSEMIKQQQELTKLAEEQKKVKEELEKQKEEQEEPKEEQEKKRKEKDENEKKEKNNGETPEGSSAIVEVRR